MSRRPQPPEEVEMGRISKTAALFGIGDLALIVGILSTDF